MLDILDPTNDALAQEEARLWNALTLRDKTLKRGRAYSKWRLAYDEMMASLRPVDPDPVYVDFAPHAHLAA